MIYVTALNYTKQTATKRVKLLTKSNAERSFIERRRYLEGHRRVGN